MLSAIILAKNEEKNISSVVESVAFCDEVLVIDNASSDKTAKIAQESGARVISLDESHFARLRNIAMEEASGDWVLFIDADESISHELQSEILQAISDAQTVAFAIPREDVFWGTIVRRGEVSKALTEGTIRLMKKGSGKWEGAVHETFRTQGPVGKLQNPLVHHAHDSIVDFLYAINNYSTRRAAELHKQGVKAHVIDITIRPITKFVWTYFFLRGFQDGPAGFVYSFMMSFHAFLVRSKLYLLQNT